MPQSLPPIPSGVAIVEKEDGSITNFFRLLWQQLIDGFQQTPTRSGVGFQGQAAALPTSTLYLVLVDGTYRVSYYMRKTTADGVSSSLTVTLGWTESGIPQSMPLPALTLDTVAAIQEGSHVLVVDQETTITMAVAYTSNTPGTMKYRLDAAVEQLA